MSYLEVRVEQIRNDMSFYMYPLVLAAVSLWHDKPISVDVRIKCILPLSATLCNSSVLSATLTPRGSLGRLEKSTARYRCLLLSRGGTVPSLPRAATTPFYWKRHWRNDANEQKHWQTSWQSNSHLDGIYKGKSKRTSVADNWSLFDSPWIDWITFYIMFIFSPIKPASRNGGNCQCRCSPCTRISGRQ